MANEDDDKNDRGPMVPRQILKRIPETPFQTTAVCFCLEDNLASARSSCNITSRSIQTYPTPSCLGSDEDTLFVDFSCTIHAILLAAWYLGHALEFQPKGTRIRSSPSSSADSPAFAVVVFRPLDDRNYHKPGDVKPIQTAQYPGTGRKGQTGSFQRIPTTDARRYSSSVQPCTSWKAAVMDKGTTSKEDQFCSAGTSFSLPSLPQSHWNHEFNRLYCKKFSILSYMYPMVLLPRVHWASLTNREFGISNLWRFQLSLFLETFRSSFFQRNGDLRSSSFSRPLGQRISQPKAQPKSAANVKHIAGGGEVGQRISQPKAQPKSAANVKHATIGKECGRGLAQVQPKLAPNVKHATNGREESETSSPEGAFTAEEHKALVQSPCPLKVTGVLPSSVYDRSL